MHSSYYIYAGESTNSYVSEVKQLPAEIHDTMANIKNISFWGDIFV